jgi:hypothetical protein
MSRTAVESDIRKTLGLVPEFLTEIPDTMLEAEWASFTFCSWRYADLDVRGGRPALCSCRVTRG